MRGSRVPEDPTPLSTAFTARFEQEFGSKPEYHSAGGYACCQVLEQAVTTTGTTDNGVLREELLRGTFDTGMGSLKFLESGLPDATIQLCQWQGDRLEIVYPKGARTHLAR